MMFVIEEVIGGLCLSFESIQPDNIGHRKKSVMASIVFIDET